MTSTLYFSFQLFGLMPLSQCFPYVFHTNCQCQYLIFQLPILSSIYMQSCKKSTRANHKSLMSFTWVNTPYDQNQIFKNHVSEVIASFRNKETWTCYSPICNYLQKEQKKESGTQTFPVPGGPKRRMPFHGVRRPVKYLQK